MFSSHVLQQMRISGTRIRTVRTFKGFLSNVVENMSSYLRTLIRSVVAHEAHKFKFVRIWSRHCRAYFTMLNYFFENYCLVTVAMFARVLVRRYICRRWKMAMIMSCYINIAWYYGHKNNCKSFRILIEKNSIRFSGYHFKNNMNFSCFCNQLRRLRFFL